MKVSRSAIRKADRAIARGWTPLCLYGPCKYLRGWWHQRRQRDRLVTPGWRPIIDGQEAE